MNEDNVSPEQIAALLDGGLGDAERASILEAIERDESLVALLADLQRLREEEPETNDGDRHTPAAEPIAARSKTASSGWHLRYLLPLAASLILAALLLPLMHREAVPTSSELLGWLEPGAAVALNGLADVTTPSTTRGGSATDDRLSAVHLGSQCSRLRGFLAIQDTDRAQSTLSALARQAESLDSLAPILPTILDLGQGLGDGSASPEQALETASEIEAFLRRRLEDDAESNLLHFELGLILEAARIGSLNGRDQTEATRLIQHILDSDSFSESVHTSAQDLLHRIQAARTPRDQFQALTSLLRSLAHSADPG